MDPQSHLLGAARRAPMNQDEFDAKFNYLKSRNRRHSTESIQSELCVCFRFPWVKTGLFGNRTTAPDESAGQQQQRWLARWRSWMPVAEWIPKYDWSRQWLGDLYGGIAFALYSIPHSLASGLLAGLSPTSGLLTTLFGTLFYSVFGSSVNSYPSPNLILCFLIRNALRRYSIPLDFGYLESPEPKIVDSNVEFELAATLTLLVGLFQLGLHFLRLDFLFSFVSRQIADGFAFGIALRAILSQLPHILFSAETLCVVNLTDSIPFLFETQQSTVTTQRTKPSLLECLESVNFYTLAIGICAFLALLFARQIAKPVFRLRSHSPFPFEFLVMGFAALVAFLMDIRGIHGVAIADRIENGIPLVLPRLRWVPMVMLDAFGLALLGNVMHRAAVNGLAKEAKCKIVERQEIIADSVSGLFGSFFGALPIGHSAHRNRIVVNAGASSLIPNLFFAALLVPLIYCADPLFSFIPICVLSAVVWSSTGEFLCRVFGQADLWRVSRLDVTTFVVAAVLATFCADSIFALFLSIGFALSTVICRAQWPKFQFLVNVTGSGAYYAEKNFYAAELLDESGLAVVRFEASLLFHNCSQFRRSVLDAVDRIKGQLLGIGIGTRSGSMKSNTTLTLAGGRELPTRSTLLISGDVVPNFDLVSLDQQMSKVVIIDFSAVPTIDATGLETIRDLFEELAADKVRILYASVNSTIRHRFKVFGGFETVLKHYFFPSVHDAVLCAQQMGAVIAPSVHMSVSMNGCRDLITLSNATSNQDLNQPGLPPLSPQRISFPDSLPTPTLGKPMFS